MPNRRLTAIATIEIATPIPHRIMSGRFVDSNSIEIAIVVNAADQIPISSAASERKNTPKLILRINARAPPKRQNTATGRANQYNALPADRVLEKL